MSVVLYRRTGNCIELAADTYGRLRDSGLSNTDSTKLFAFDKFAIGHVGTKSFMQYCNEKLQSLAAIDFTVVGLRQIFEEIVEGYKDKVNHTCIIVGNGKAFCIDIDDNKIDACEEITTDLTGIGFFEMPIGAVLAGKSLSEAIHICAERNAYFGGDVTYIKINV